MRKTLKKKTPPEKIGNYFLDDKKDINFIKSGCVLQDCVLGGGWAMGRIGNIIGDKSSGKTLAAIEASANFIRDYPEGEVHYLEVEDAFDKGYALALGMPVDRVTFIGNIETVEDWYRNVDSLVKQRTKQKKLQPLLYIVDSLDALTDEAEKERDISDGSYGNKAKKMSEIFRRWIHGLGEAEITLLIVSQTRDKIGVVFGSKITRSGGKALDFYASQILLLALKKKLKKTYRKVEQVYALDIKATCTKNKVGLPLRECEFILRFGYGIDDVVSSLNWIKIVKGLGDLGIDESGIEELAKEINEGDKPELKLEIQETVKRIWKEIQSKFLPKKSKY